MNICRHRLIPRPEPRLLSIVIPAFNEEEVLPLLRARMTQFMDQLPVPCELIVVNDGSSDGTLELLIEWTESDPRVQVLGLARCFGHQIALTAGLDVARGDAIVAMDADLQDPPEVIGQMLAEYCRGYDVVYGKRVARSGETAFKRASAWLFYRLMRTFVHRELPADVGDFRLISRRCLDALKSMNEIHRFLRGMMAWIGFSQTCVEFKRPPRAAGTTKYSWFRMLRFAWTAAVSFSPAPLRLSWILGFLLALVGFSYGLIAVVRVMLGLYVVPGWTSTLVVNCLIGGGILISIGVLGEYVARIFEEVKGRPLYIVATHIRCEAQEENLRACGEHSPEADPPSNLRVHITQPQR